MFKSIHIALQCNHDTYAPRIQFNYLLLDRAEMFANQTTRTWKVTKKMYQFSQNFTTEKSSQITES